MEPNAVANDEAAPPGPAAPGEGQEPTVVAEVLPKITQRLAQTVPDAVSALAVGRSRGIGHDALHLASAYMAEVRGDFEDLRGQLREARAKADDIGEKLRAAEIANASLSERAAGQRTLDNIFKGVGIVSAALIGVGVDLFKGSQDMAPLGTILIGCGIAGVIASCASFGIRKQQ